MFLETKKEGETVIHEPWQEILLEAANIMERRGFVQHCAICDEGVCARGAIVLAILKDVVPDGNGVSVDLRQMYFSMTDENISLFLRAEYFLQCFLALSGKIGNVVGVLD